MTQHSDAPAQTTKPERWLSRYAQGRNAGLEMAALLHEQWARHYARTGQEGDAARHHEWAARMRGEKYVAE